MKCLAFHGVESHAIALLRGYSVIMIVLCHILQGLHNHWAWVLNIGVQIFFILSGYLYGKKEIIEAKSWYVQRAIKILSPFYLYVFFAILTILFWHPEMLSWKKNLFYAFNLQGIGGGIMG